MFADRTVRAQGEFDADLIRLTPESSPYIEELRKIDERFKERAHEARPRTSPSRWIA